jgi:mRNA-degrading endonuclease HigB of HigAB toxin-antitoxin module
MLVFKLRGVKLFKLVFVEFDFSKILLRLVLAHLDFFRVILDHWIG